MSMNFNNLLIERNTQQPRRVGLSRDYRPPSMLRTINGRPNDSVAPADMSTKTTKTTKTTNPTKSRFLAPRKGIKAKEMAVELDLDDDDLLASPKAASKQKKGNVEEEELNLLAAPKGSSSDEDSSSEDERGKSMAIKSTVFGPAKSVSNSKSSIGNGKSSVQSSAGVANSRNTKTTKATISPRPGSPKRKIQATTDLFGNLNTKKKAKLTYGSSQSKKLTLSQVSKPISTQDDDDDTTTFIQPDTILPTPQKIQKPGFQFKMPENDGLDSPSERPTSSNTVKSSAQRLEDLKDSKWAVPDSDDEENTVNFSSLPGLGSPEQEKPPPRKIDPDLAKFHAPATQAPEFINFSLDELDDSDLLSKTKDIVRRGDDFGLRSIDDIGPALLDDDEPYDYHLLETQLPSTCPMCQAPVDPDELKARGKMNTRAQEQFCQSHQRKTAQEDWENRGYPKIDWSKLPLRLSKLGKTIDSWINGEVSHYRSQYGARVAAGQDRTLRKQTSNLIPGYYGSRGLQVISHHVMQNYTHLLKKVAPKDTLIAKNGVAAYVQAVLVFEIATLLIMEDMGVDGEKAREILDESVVIGELLQDEIQDVHVRRVEDSEDDETSEDELA